MQADLYHVLIKTNAGFEERLQNLTEEKLLEKFVLPYREGSDLFINGRSIPTTAIDRVHIRKTEEPIAQIAKRIQRQKDEENHNSSVVFLGGQSASQLAMWEGENVLDDFITGPPGYAVKKQVVSIDEPEPKSMVKTKVFLVHGQNEEMKQSVARFLEKLKIELVILHEQPSKGRTIIEKFSDYSDVHFAIILLSADDFAYPKNQSPDNGLLRARQNVILELGFFLGKLGRGNVLSLYEDGQSIEIPSDYRGVIYLPYGAGNGWQMDLLRELKAAEFSVDANSIL